MPLGPCHLADTASPSSAATVPAVRHFFARVAGESYLNRDGTRRQAIIATCRVGERILLEPEPENPQYDHAVRLLREDGRQIGYLERGMAARLIDDLAAFTAFVAGIPAGPYLSVSLLMVMHEGRDAAAVEAYAHQVLKDRLRKPRKRRTRGLALILVILLVVALTAWWGWSPAGDRHPPPRLRGTRAVSWGTTGLCLPQAA
jgi:hypothetical protein